MTTTPQERTEELSKAYKQVIDLSFAAIETGWEQITAAAKLFTAAASAEKDEAGKTLESAMTSARGHNEKLADLLKDPATFSPSGAAGFIPETKEFVDELIEGEKSLYQSLTEYSAGLEKRQTVLFKKFSESHSEIIGSTQELAKSAAAYGEAFLEWSREATAGISTNKAS